MTDYTKSRHPKLRWGSLEIQRVADKISNKKLNLRDELEVKQMQVTAGKIVESSDVALAIYEYAEEEINKSENTLNTSEEIPIYRSGWLQGYKKGMRNVQNHILGLIRKGDSAGEEINKLEEKEREEAQRLTTKKKIDEDFEKLEKVLEEE